MNLNIDQFTFYINNQEINGKKSNIYSDKFRMKIYLNVKAA